MTDDRIKLLLNLICEAITEGHPWWEQAKSILAVATDEDKNNLFEFSAWFLGNDP
jgi:hypothetical protein